MLDQVPWFVARGAGAVSLLMLTASACLGLVTITQIRIRLTDAMSGLIIRNLQADIPDFTAVVLTLSHRGGGVAAAFAVVVLRLLAVLAGLVLVALLVLRPAPRLLALVRHESAPIAGLPLVHVTDTLVALGALARGHARRIRALTHAPCVAVGGAAGKTPTKELCAAV